MDLKPLLDGVAKGDLVFRKDRYIPFYSFYCTIPFYNSMVDVDLGDCAKCRFNSSRSKGSTGCTLPSTSQLKHHIPYLRKHHPELFI